jgi:hypothetical protein
MVMTMLLAGLNIDASDSVITLGAMATAVFVLAAFAIRSGSFCSEDMRTLTRSQSPEVSFSNQPELRERAPKTAATRCPTTRESAANPAERRASLRRDGNPIPISIQIDLAEPVVIDGTVLDRSRGGLCVSVACEIPEGKAIRLRPAGGDAGEQWIEVQIKRSRKRKNSWELGCQFTHEHDWGTLLKFG